LKRYYDQNDEKVKALQNDLAQMQTIALNPQLPDISGSLNLLQRLSAPSLLPNMLPDIESKNDFSSEIPLITEDKTENPQNTEREVTQ
jgi:uncharacterized protein HemX